MNRSVSLDIIEWLELCQSGACPPVKITLAGNSMRPLIRKDRDLVIIVPLRRSPKIGDVVLFSRPDGSYVVHRLYKADGDTVQTLGDGCLRPDVPMPLASVCGLVTTVERGRCRLRLDTAAARLYGRIWMNLLPLHRLIARAKQFTRRIFRYEH